MTRVSFAAPSPRAPRAATAMSVRRWRPGDASTLRLIRKNSVLLFFILAVISSFVAVHVHNITEQWRGSVMTEIPMLAVEQNKSLSNLSSKTIQTAGDFAAPSFLGQAIDSCNAARDKSGKYPSVYKQIVAKRQLRWRKQKEDGKFNFIQMINNKLGGYLYATKLGVPTPQVLFCGVAKDLPRNISSFGKKYVVKPLDGFSAKGVKVVKDGVNILKGKKVSYSALIKEYGPERNTIVEELIESVHPKYKNLVPPDYKFYVYEGRPEILRFIDRNGGKVCKGDLHVSSTNWTLQGDLLDRSKPNCSPDKYYSEPSRQAALIDAVRVLAGNAGKNWIRIDMFDGRDGPILGEFTPFANNGQDSPFLSCVMSYLFIAHAEHGGSTDDAETVRGINSTTELKSKLGMNQTGVPMENIHHPKFDFFPPEAHEWAEYDELEKCNKVREAQHELNQKQVRDSVTQ